MWLSRSPLPAQVGFPQARLTDCKQMGSPVAGAPESASAVVAMYDRTGPKQPRERRPWTPLLPVGAAGHQDLTPQRQGRVLETGVLLKRDIRHGSFIFKPHTDTDDQGLDTGRPREACALGLGGPAPRGETLGWSRLQPQQSCRRTGWSRSFDNEGLHFHRLFVA